MVPPVVQEEDAVCRYHQFVERPWPFTRSYAAVDSDMAALHSEYGIIVGAGAVMFLLLGMTRKG